MERFNGLRLLDEREGEGVMARKGDRVVFNMKLFLNRGEEVPLNEEQAQYLPGELMRVQDGRSLIDRTVTLGRREVIAGVERALIGMKVGGYRKVRISPHLAYRDQGLADFIPPRAVLIAELWLRAVLEASTVQTS